MNTNMNTKLSRWTRAAILAGGLAAGSLQLGCQSTQTTRDTDSGETRTTTTTTWGTYRPALGPNEAMSEMAFPTGEVRTSAILLHQVTPVEVSRGSEFDFSYHVTNLTSAALQNVSLSLDSKSNLEIVDSDPSGNVSNDAMVWSIGELGPKETRVISLTGVAEDVGIASDCITVSYNNFLCSTVRVVEPALALTKTATERVLECDEITLVYTVRNTGTGVANDVSIKDTLPNGLSMANGSRNVSIPVGALASGESRSFEVKATASRTGTFESAAMAMGDGGLEAESRETETEVVAPELALSAECRDEQFLGRNMTYTYTLENIGDGEAAGSTASVTLPSGTRFVSASSGGGLVGNRVLWDFGTMSAGAERSFSVTLSAADTGSYTATATAQAACADAVTQSCTTDVEGIPAILLEVIDVTDPVEVGTDTVYVISVTNQGSAPATNVQIRAELPDEQAYVGSTGSTDANVRGQVISFAPVGRLAVGGSAQWRVTIRAQGEGDVRFRVEMTSNELTSPVNETEATNLYE